MRIEIHRCPSCPLLQAHAAALASALRTDLGAEVLLLDGKPSGFSVLVNGEPLIDRNEGLPSIHHLLCVLRNVIPANVQAYAKKKATSCQPRLALRNCRLPGMYHNAGQECVAGINLLPPVWFQRCVIRSAIEQAPPPRPSNLVGEPSAVEHQLGCWAIDVTQPVGEAVAC
jgi:hypothetical protein